MNRPEIRAEMRIVLKMLRGMSDIEYRIISTVMGRKALDYVRRSWKNPALAARLAKGGRSDAVAALRRELARLR